ncbi:MAG TPA: hypothetical protein VGJ73_16400 [Verrucomicrobiae bacterium]
MAASAGEDFELAIHSHVSGAGYTNTWWVPMSTFTNLPGWDEKGEPPLSVGQAVSLAKAWLVSKGFSTNIFPSSVRFVSSTPGVPQVPPNDPYKLRPRWFYIIEFGGVYLLGSSATCVVLPDGSVVDPETSPPTTNMWRYLD